jgi:Xaa-Pro aminopeptidase
VSAPLARADAVEAALEERGTDALLVTDLANVRWLTGFSGSAGAAVVGPGGARAFVTDFRYLTQSAEELDPAWERRIVPELLAGCAEALTGARRAGFEDQHTSVRDHRKLADLLGDGAELVACGGVVEDRRAIKDEEEVAAIRRAAEVADAAFEEVLGAGVVGRTERDVALDLEVAMRRRGASGASFPPIVAAGAHGALPHAQPRDVPIPAGTLLVVDWGAQVGGYASDCTRTVATGELDPRDAEVYEVVRRAQEAALAAIRPGTSGRDADQVARDVIDRAGHAEHFGHGLGHGVGLEVHEGPRLSQRSDAVLEAGMVVTVEPGVYVPGAVGVRIEDLVVVRDGAPEVLTSLPKGLRTYS